jgi:hypothetical protein
MRLRDVINVVSSVEIPLPAASDGSGSDDCGADPHGADPSDADPSDDCGPLAA